MSLYYTIGSVAAADEEWLAAWKYYKTADQIVFRFGTLHGFMQPLMQIIDTRTDTALNKPHSIKDISIHLQV